MTNSPRSKANTKEHASASSYSTQINPSIPWSVVASGKGKKGNKRQLISFKPTIAQPISSITDSNQALSGQTPPAPVELVRPFLKGAEKGSVLIDITHIKDLNLLPMALDEFNKDADTAGRGYNKLLGRCEKIAPI